MRKNKTTSKRNKLDRAQRSYWLTPKAWKRSCSECGADQSVAIRWVDQRSLCAECVERLGVKAQTSRSAREVGGALSPVKVRRVDPETMDW